MNKAPFDYPPVGPNDLEAWWLHRKFLKWSELPRFELLVKLNRHARGFDFNRRDFHQLYRAWVANKEFYIERFADIDRRYFGESERGDV